MNIFQIAILLFIGMTIFRLAVKLRKRIFSPGLFIVWLVLWLIIAIFVAQPEWLSHLANLAGIGRGVDLAIYLAIILLIYTQIRLSIRFEEQDRRLSQLVRKLSINNVQSNDTKSRDHSS